MSEKSNKFDNKNINQSKFYKTKRLFKIDDINMDKILFSKKEPYGKKVHLMELHSNIILLMKIMIILVLYV